MPDTHDRTNALRAVAHPLRLQILSLLTGTELSAAEVARELGVTHANASYHLRVLLEAGKLEIASEEKIHGGVAKRYRYPFENEISSKNQRPSQEDRALYARVMAEELVRRARATRVGEVRSHLTDAELWVSPDEYRAAEEAITAASLQLHQAARPPRTAGTIRVSLTAAMFEMEPVEMEQDPP
jgi:DNA-binding transcriptional ArsR family regulator